MCGCCCTIRWASASVVITVRLLVIFRIAVSSQEDKVMFVVTEVSSNADLSPRSQSVRWAWPATLSFVFLRAPRSAASAIPLRGLLLLRTLSPLDLSRRGSQPVAGECLQQCSCASARTRQVRYCCPSGS
jgi:hypothetical protein